jgi:hypothetical protein
MDGFIWVTHFIDLIIISLFFFIIFFSLIYYMTSYPLIPSRSPFRIRDSQQTKAQHPINSK